MKTTTLIGIDLAKNVFQLHGVDDNGRKVFDRKLTRGQVVPFFANLPSCAVAMEACASSQYWARVIEELGHEVKRLPAQFVTPYRRGNKTDATDAAAICEAAQRPNMRFVPNKSHDQADIQAVHRVRNGFVQGRTAVLNRARGLLGEYGIIIPQGAAHVRKHLICILDDILPTELSGLMRGLLQTLYTHLVRLEEEIEALDKQLRIICQNREECKRLMKIPGIGPMNATSLVCLCGHASNFNKSRAFASFLGLTPKEFSSGGKQRLSGITKRGNSYARSLLVHGARAVLRAIQRGHSPYGGGRMEEWIKRLIERRGMNKACVALANKMARIAWRLIVYKEDFRPAMA